MFWSCFSNNLQSDIKHRTVTTVSNFFNLPPLLSKLKNNLKFINISLFSAKTAEPNFGEIDTKIVPFSRGKHSH